MIINKQLHMCSGAILADFHWLMSWLLPDVLSERQHMTARKWAISLPHLFFLRVHLFWYLPSYYRKKASGTWSWKVASSLCRSCIYWNSNSTGHPISLLNLAQQWVLASLQKPLWASFHCILTMKGTEPSSHELEDRIELSKDKCPHLHGCQEGRRI